MLSDVVADHLLEADVVSHLKKIVSEQTVAVELLHNSLTLGKHMAAIGQCEIMLLNCSVQRFTASYDVSF